MKGKSEIEVLNNTRVPAMPWKKAKMNDDLLRGGVLLRAGHHWTDLETGREREVKERTPHCLKQ